VRLAELFADVPGSRILGNPDVEISDVTYRSDRACPGCLFFCVPGFVRDGHDFGADAAARGAAALCVERPLDVAVPLAIVPSVRRAMGQAAAAFFGQPSSRLRIAGITGTNGKTTSAFLTAHLLDRAGLRSGLMGTVERRVGGRSYPAGRTTPEAIDVQRDLAAMVAAGDRAAVMEVSSHALDLGRVLGVSFSAIAFTNLTQDHLDYHHTLDAYFDAKTRLFLDPEFAAGKPVAVINVNDPFGRRLARRLQADTARPPRLLAFSSVRSPGGWDPDLELSAFEMDSSGIRGRLVLRGRALGLLRAAGQPVGAGGAGRAGEVERTLKTGLVGRFNVDNLLTALGLGLGFGLDLDVMLAAVAGFTGVPGRMERVDAGQGFAVLVDYAHTPDSIANVLRTARSITSGRLVALIGCGGDRDKGKRPKMGREAEIGADIVIVTSDNPRSEDPRAIIEDILAGLERPDEAVVEPDRKAAIETALREARAHDVVLILGKGHESGQEFAGGRSIPFDDRQVARRVLAELLEQRR
jgi:UDP-N-acetylmuramoyl-L-alanyl-D-glutamate--2,6-diaminopimelate ligase